MRSCRDGERGEESRSEERGRGGWCRENRHGVRVRTLRRGVPSSNVAGWPIPVEPISITPGKPSDDDLQDSEAVRRTPRSRHARGRAVAFVADRASVCVDLRRLRCMPRPRARRYSPSIQLRWFVVALRQPNVATDRGRANRGATDRRPRCRVDASCRFTEIWKSGCGSSRLSISGSTADGSDSRRARRPR